ncbi:hypothetical protein CRENBAI_001153 [Crenichthys baileyi]|uniref:Uncharacterized protein n=1 Tax=Crenichthys baileyi TaxID=28760 RepID=A0AAV9S272_9TELE
MFKQEACHEYDPTPERGHLPTVGILLSIEMTHLPVKHQQPALNNAPSFCCLLLCVREQHPSVKTAQYPQCSLGASIVRRVNGIKQFFASLPPTSLASTLGFRVPSCTGKYSDCLHPRGKLRRELTGSLSPQEETILVAVKAADPVASVEKECMHRQTER